MSNFQDPTEEFVAKFCLRTFLSLWGFANPASAAKGKELCDYLVVFGDNVLIFSVKNITMKEGGVDQISRDRWRRKAIENSVSQIYGAERALRRMGRVLSNESKYTIDLPAQDDRKIFRIAVALGSNGKVGLQHGDFGKGFVHVFDEITFPLLLSELDTITDFVEYLGKKEALISDSTVGPFVAQEEDLLAFYLRKGRDFSNGQGLTILHNDIWSGFSTSSGACT
jgi:hypothetical protein